MSGMTEAIDRMAACAEQRNFRSSLKYLMICCGYDPSYGSDPTITTINLTPEQIKELELAAGGYPPRLNLNQIREITKDYPFQLTIELYELYQRGNGCLPIGLNSKKDWNSLDNYFVFPDLDEPFYPIQEAIKRYQVLTEYRERYNIEPRWFPISEFEDWMQVIVGSEEEQETSPADCLTEVDESKME